MKEVCFPLIYPVVVFVLCRWSTYQEVVLHNNRDKKRVQTCHKYRKDPLQGLQDVSLINGGVGVMPVSMLDTQCISENGSSIMTFVLLLVVLVDVITRTICKCK